MKKFLALLAVLALAAAPATAAEGVVITRVEGNAVIVGPSGERAASQGAACQTEERVETKAGGTVDIAVAGMAGCRLLPETKCKIMGAADNMKLAVEDGNVILNLQKLPAGSTFELETPTAIAAVRGTQFWGRVLPSEGSNQVTFAVREGAVDVFMKSANKTVRVEAGQAIDVPAGGDELPAVRPALDQELAAMAQAPGILTSL